MAGILDFLSDVVRNRDLSGAFFSVAASPDCTRQDLLEFFNTNGFSGVTEADVGKILAQKENIKRDFAVPPNVDY
jgi:hypothetical protein